MTDGAVYLSRLAWRNSSNYQHCMCTPDTLGLLVTQLDAFFKENYHLRSTRVV